MRNRRMTGAAVVALTAFILTSPAHAGILSASAGVAQDSSLASCFQRNWQAPGRVSLTCMSPDSAWWEIPVPITSTGTKTFRVFTRVVYFGAECDAFVLSGNGSFPRWAQIQIQPSPGQILEGWNSFAPLAVNASEAAEISCQTGRGGPTEYISAVEGF